MSLRATAYALMLGLLCTACGDAAGKRQAAHSDEAAGGAFRTIRIGEEFFDKGATDTIRFGRMHSGEIAQLQFRIANQSERPTAIRSYERNCGCTTLEYAQEPFAPGAARQVAISFDSRGTRGWQLKTVEIRLAGGSKPLKLFVEAEIE